MGEMDGGREGGGIVEQAEHDTGDAGAEEGSLGMRVVRERGADASCASSASPFRKSTCQARCRLARGRSRRSPARVAASASRMRPACAHAAKPGSMNRIVTRPCSAAPKWSAASERVPRQQQSAPQVDRALARAGSRRKRPRDSSLRRRPSRRDRRSTARYFVGALG